MRAIAGAIVIVGGATIWSTELRTEGHTLLGIFLLAVGLWGLHVGLRDDAPRT